MFNRGGDTWEKHTNSKQVRGTSLVVIFHWGDVMIVQAWGERQEVFIFHSISHWLFFIRLFFTPYWWAPMGNHGGQTPALLPETNKTSCLILDFCSNHIIFLQLLQWIQWLNTTKTVHCHMCAIKGYHLAFSHFKTEQNNHGEKNDKEGRGTVSVPLLMPETSEAAQGKPSSGACGSAARGWNITAGRWCTRGRRGRRWRKTSASKCPPWWRRSRRRRTVMTRTGAKQQRAVWRDRQRSGAFGAMTKRAEARRGEATRGDSSPSSTGASKQEVVNTRLTSHLFTRLRRIIIIIIGAIHS